MSKDIEKVARNFWEEQSAYPGYDYIKERRFHELLYVLPRIQKAKPTSLIDIGCGTGSTITLLRELCHVEAYFCYDISPGMLAAVDTENNRDSLIHTEVVDFTEDYRLAMTEFCLCLGLLQCLSDNNVERLLSRIQSKRAIFRNTCELKKRNTINVFSEKLGAYYSSTYRTIDEYVQMLCGSGFRVLDMERCYPDEIESEYGTKQYFFDCERI